MISIAMFNNKGGVGKTTLTCNIASYFASIMKKRVLVVDCDPQCNATQLIMGEEYTTELYLKENQGNEITTIRNILQPIEDGDSNINEAVVPLKSSSNRFNVDLIPGHPGFSIIEDRLGAAWHDSFGGDLGGLRRTNWNTHLCSILKNKYDFVFFDLGPSLGSINRSVLIGCQKFLTPMGTDIFSILGVRNIAEWLNSWSELYESGVELCEKRNVGKVDQYKIQKELKIKNGYLGYTMQQYITKSKQGVRRPTKAYERIINNVPGEVLNSLGSYFSDSLDVDHAKLGDIPHLYSLIPLAQSVSSPILDLKSSDGLVGSQFKQREEYNEIIGNIVKNLFNNIEKGNN